MLRPDKAVEQSIDAARQVLLLTHVEPDADALGSLLGLGKGLQLLGKAKRVVMACNDPIPSRYAQMPGSREVVSMPPGSFDLIISLDCADQERMGGLYQQICQSKPSNPLLNIDHHISNTRFGSLNWVEPRAVATAEMVMDLLDLLGAPLDTDIATCLLYGIVGDTQAFRTPNVSPPVLARAIRLMQMGAPLQRCITDLFQLKPPGLLAVWGHALSTMHIEDGLAWTSLSAQTRHACGYPSTDGLQLSSLLLEAEGVDVTATLVEKDAGTVDLSMRARNGFDVSGLAVELGGGGHPNAAGANLPGPLEEATQQVVTRLKRLVSSGPRA
ncbi:MAG: DHH family phosphoesterase [Thermoflexales bacterium]|nr:DHH family phosphoesterase [Thermoflexales bacterium]